MSQRAKWLLLIAAATCVPVTAIVYSRQGIEVQDKNAAAVQQPQRNPSPVAAPKSTPDADIPKPICTLNATQAPALRGLKLGMTVDEVLALFPGSREDIEVRADLARKPQYGITRFLIRPEKFASKEKFTGIKKITFTFLDGRMSNMNAGYETHEWKDVDEFVAKFSKGKNLPPIEAWDAQVGMDTQKKTLKCNGFEISAFAGGTDGAINYIQMRIPAADKELNARREKARQQAEKEAKP